MKASNILPIFAFFAASLLLMTSCKKDPTLGSELPEYAKVLLFHGVPSVDGVDVYIDGSKKTSASVTYGKETGYLQTGTTARKLQTKSVQGTIIDSSTLNVKKDVSYSYYVYKESDGKNNTIATTDALTAPAAGKTKIRIIHLIPDIANSTPIDIQAVAVGGAPSFANDFTNVKFRDSRDYYEIPKGTYDLKVKYYTTINPVIPYASTTNITFAEGKIYTLVVHGFKSKSNTDPQAAKLSIIKNN